MRFDTTVGLVSILAGIVSIVFGTVGAIVLWEAHPKLVCASFMLILVGVFCVLLWFFSRHYRGKLQHSSPIMEEIREGVLKIMKKLQDMDYDPDLIIAFNRSGGVAAGMLAVNLKVRQVIVLDRRLRDRGSNQETRFEVGSLVESLDGQ